MTGKLLTEDKRVHVNVGDAGVAKIRKTPNTISMSLVSHIFARNLQMHYLEESSRKSFLIYTMAELPALQPCAYAMHGITTESQKKNGRTLKRS